MLHTAQYENYLKQTKKNAEQVEVKSKADEKKAKEGVKKTVEKPIKPIQIKKPYLNIIVDPQYINLRTNRFNIILSK